MLYRLVYRWGLDGMRVREPPRAWTGLTGERGGNPPQGVPSDGLWGARPPSPSNPLLHPLPPEGRHRMQGRAFRRNARGCGGGGLDGRPCIPSGCKAIEGVGEGTSPNSPTPFHIPTSFGPLRGQISSPQRTKRKEAQNSLQGNPTAILFVD